MKFFLLFLIRLYWIVPKKWRRPCLFKCSCSVKVYNTAKADGFLAGVKVLLKRYKQCRPGYTTYISDDLKEWVIFFDGSIEERSVTNI
jgi:uncharacterized protein